MNLQLYIVKLTLSFKGPLKVERSSHMNNEHECPSRNLNIPPMITTQGFHDRNYYKLSQCYQHDDNVSIRVVPQLPQPALNVLVGQVLGNVVDKQGTNCTPVVPGHKRSINSKYNHLCKHVLLKDLHDNICNSCEISIENNARS